MAGLLLAACLCLVATAPQAAAEDEGEIEISLDPAATKTTCTDTVMNIVAHQDDDLVFFGGAEISDIAAGKCVVTVYVTAGNSGGASDYWLMREAATLVAHETMSDAPHRPAIDGSIKVGGRKVAVRGLARNKRVALIFLRLPEGTASGQGIPESGPSLLKLFNGDITTISTVPDAAIDGLAQDASYTKEGLTSALFRLMKTFSVTKIRTQNYLDAPLDGASGAIDHSDHVVTAKLAFAAATRYARLIDKSLKKVLVGYRGYEVHRLQQNQFGDTLDLKLKAFDDYAKIDRSVCADPVDCLAYRETPSEHWGYPRWLRRQYPVAAAQVDFANAPIRGWGDKCLEVRGPASADGAVIQMSECIGPEALEQQWAYDPETRRLVSAFADKCARATPGGVVLQTCSSSPGDLQQQWLLGPDDELRGVGVGGCLNVPGDAPRDGVAVTVEPCDFQPRQLFGYEQLAIVPIPHTIVAEHGGNCLTMGPGATPTVTVATCRSPAIEAQQWYFTPGGFLRNRHYGLCAGAAANGQPIQGQDCRTLSTSQQWVFEAPDRQIANAGETALKGKCFELRGGSDQPGAQVQTQTCLGPGKSGQIAQRWLIDGRE